MLILVFGVVDAAKLQLLCLEREREKESEKIWAKKRPADWKQLGKKREAAHFGKSG